LAPKAYVYLGDLGISSNRRPEMGMTTFTVLNAAQAIAEIEMATGLALRSLLAKMRFPSGNCSLRTRKRCRRFEKAVLRGLTAPICDRLDSNFSEFLANILFRLLYRKVLFAGVRSNRADSVVRICCDLRPAKMNHAKSFLRDLDDAVSRGTADSRTRALWHATDLLIAGRYSDDEIWTFGEVIGLLADAIEVAARAQLARRLARFDNAPANIIHKLAFDDSIDVAGPVLQESERLEAYALVANACTKSQTHLLAISKRKFIAETVTDVLVTRGNQEVVNSVASNNGARFSDFGFLHMITRAEGDSILAEQLGLRKDIPRHLFQQLIAKASDDVKKRIERERPEMVEQIQTSVTDVTGALHSKFGPASRSYFVAKRLVTTQHQHGNLNENSIFDYARSHKLDEVTIGLSLLCSLPGDVIERALLDKNREMILVLTKALDFSWATTMALLFLGAKDHRITAQELRDLESEFGRLNVETSRSVLKLYQTRKTAAGADSAPARQAPLPVH
jgi:uncharacterized protein (DUF2336 family)